MKLTLIVTAEYPDEIASFTPDYFATIAAEKTRKTLKLYWPVIPWTVEPLHPAPPSGLTVFGVPACPDCLAGRTVGKCPNCDAGPA